MVKRQDEGFTLAELILALGLLAILIVSMIGLFTSLLGGSNKTTNLTAGQLFAAQKLEQLIQLGTYNSDTAGQGGIYVTDPNSRMNFYYQVTSTAVSRVAAPADKSYMGGYYVTVQVWWNTNSPTKARAGVGMQTASVSRFVYPRASVP